MKPILIIQAGHTFPEIAAAHGDFDDMVYRALNGKQRKTRVVDVSRAAVLPAPSSCAAAVITGSHEMVSDKADWSERTARWLSQAHGHGLPLFGLCYGHQLLAHALGGEAGDNPNGLEIGTQTIERLPACDDDPLFAPLGSRFPAHTVHRQSALKLPPQAVLLCRNPHEAHHAFRLGKHTWGVQFHPEFSADVMNGYLRRHHGRKNGSDPVQNTPEAAALLQRFANYVSSLQAV